MTIFSAAPKIYVPPSVFSSSFVLLVRACFNASYLSEFLFDCSISFFEFSISRTHTGLFFDPPLLQLAIACPQLAQDDYQNASSMFFSHLSSGFVLSSIFFFRCDLSA